ncbi:hypothetical protein GF312_07695 [Candidatus Poribacteria bacterium]|nr:hypothetical protein [Candidatus Poribacteria bacterium]
MAKKRKIKNMTRAQHKQALERSANLQAAAVREAKGHVFLPKLNRSTGKKSGDLYQQVVEAGHKILERYQECGKIIKGDKYDTIVSYYSRKDIQQAMFDYAKGRKLSIVRTFQPMFNGSQLRKPEDILPIMIFYSQERRYWPSMHGTVSRYDSVIGSVCDLILEVDFKKSRTTSFNLARPIVNMLSDLGVEFRIKFSGHASPHIIIPAEVFPPEWRRPGKYRGLYGKMLDFFKGKLKQPKTLDRSFRNPRHFLRMPYSLNESTGLVSLPLDIEQYSRFSWEMARPEFAQVKDNWWPVYDDSCDGMRELIEIVIGQRKHIPVRKKRKELELNQNLPPVMPFVLGAPIKMGIIKTGEQIAENGISLLNDTDIQNTVKAVSDHEDEINDQNIQLALRWAKHTDAIKHYSRPDVQEFMCNHLEERCMLLKGTDEYITIDGDSTCIPALAAYMVGGGVTPFFRCTNARYDFDSGDMKACDIVLTSDLDSAESLSTYLQNMDLPAYAMYDGSDIIRFVLPFDILDTVIKPGFPLSRFSYLAMKLKQQLRQNLGNKANIKVSLYEECCPVPYSVSEDGMGINGIFCLEYARNLTRDDVSITKYIQLEEIESMISFNRENNFKLLESLIS